MKCGVCNRNFKPLFATIVGSTMWDMNSMDSDVDLACVYNVPTRQILNGKFSSRDATLKQMKIDKGRKKLDLVCQEIGHLINQLVKGNVNAVWIVMSPKIVTSGDTHMKLREIVEKNLSKMMYPSIHGLAVSQLGQADIFHEDNPNHSKYNRSAMRTLYFGINLFREREVIFEPIFGDVERWEILDALLYLEECFKNSKLNESVNEEDFRSFLYDVRMDDLTYK